MKNTEKRYVVYTRCSTAEQEKGFSHPYQFSGIQSHPMLRDWSFQGHYQDTGTGTRFDNRQNLDLIHSLYENNRGALDYLLVYRFDRLGRDVGEAFQMIRKFADIGVQINSPSKWIDYSDPHWPVILGIEFGMAQSESLKISDRTRDGLYQANFEGYYTGPVPVGYKRRETEKTRGSGKRVKLLVPDPEKAPLVRMVFELFAAGTENRTDLFRRYGQQLGIRETQFFAMLTNPIYTGQIELKAYKNRAACTVSGRHEAIVDQELFSRVQQRIKEHPRREFLLRSKNKAENHFYLKGFIRCPEGEGRFLTAYQVRKKTTGTLFYYYALAGGSYVINAITAHQSISSLLSCVELPRELYEETRTKLVEMIRANQERNRAALHSLTESIRKCERRIENITNAMADGDLPAAEYARLRQKYRLELSQLERQVTDLSQQVSEEMGFRLKLLDVMANIGDFFRSASFEGKRAILQAIFPEGFAIESGGIVLTERINTFVAPMILESAHCKALKLKTGAELQSAPVGGRWPGDDLTEKDKAAIAAMLNIAA